MNAKYQPPTSEEVDRRLRIVSELRNLCLSLGRAQKVAVARMEERVEIGSGQIADQRLISPEAPLV